MSEALLIGVDIGTQGVKAAVYDAQGRCHGEAFRNHLAGRPHLAFGIFLHGAGHRVQQFRFAEGFAEALPLTVIHGGLHALGPDIHADEQFWAHVNSMTFFSPLPCMTWSKEARISSSGVLIVTRSFTISRPDATSARVCRYWMRL